MCYSDDSPTCYRLQPITEKDNPNNAQNEPQAQGMITHVEQLALGAVDVAKVISEPVDKFDVAKLVIGFVARQARERRASSAI